MASSARPAAKKLALLATAAGTAAYIGYKSCDTKSSLMAPFAAKADVPMIQPKYKKGLPTRAEQIKNLQQTPEFDILVIGGGATGTGVALDAVTRGLTTALVEADDFASGTSSKSTKLIHGGVRYLQKAIMNVDYDQYKMVKEALEERSNLIKIAPHLAHPLPIMLPVYKWWQVPYFWVGIKMYDLVAGSENLKSSYLLSAQSALELFPMLKSESLKGAIVYYDGQQDDSRTCLSIALTAVRYGAAVSNHVSVTKLLKDSDGKVCGATVKDQFTGKTWDVKAKVVVNATGPFTDEIRKMDDENSKAICQPSAGVHIVLPGYYSPESMGLLDPATSDGRVIFFLPWLDYTIAGTTDKPCDVTRDPAPTEGDIQFILSEIKKYLNKDVHVRRGDVMSAWSGIRPLVLDPSKPNTESLARNHIIYTSPNRLVTIAGGKWTTYRRMAEETVDECLKVNPELKPLRKCQTSGLLLEGAHGWNPTLFIRLVQDYGLDTQVATNLANSYGDRAFAVAKLAELTGHRWPVVGNRLHPELPYINAEVRFAIREYACTAVDVIARRLRLSFLNATAATEALPKIIEVMAQELKWSKAEAQKQHDEALAFLKKQMGFELGKDLRQPVELTLDEVGKYSRQFEAMDRDNKGYIGINDLRRSLKASGQQVTDAELHTMLNEVDTNQNGQIELNEYLELMSAIKTGQVAANRLATIAEMEYTRALNKIAVERSGGGV